MKNLGKYLILLGTVGMPGLYSLIGNAHASTGSDDIYSESIYIERSSAEVPTSIESNARLNGETTLAANDNVSSPEVAAVENQPVKAKKAAKKKKR